MGIMCRPLGKITFFAKIMLFDNFFSGVQIGCKSRKTFVYVFWLFTPLFRCFTLSGIAHGEELFEIYRFISKNIHFMPSGSVFENLSYISRKSIEHLSKIYRKSIEHLSKIYRTSIENLSNIYRKSIENLSSIYRTSIENLSNIYRKSMDLGWTWGRSWVDRGWILGVSGCIWVDHGPPPETQFSLVNDTFTQAFGRSKDKRFFILHATPSARRNVRSHAFGCLLLLFIVVVYCWLSLGKNKDRLCR